MGRNMKILLSEGSMGRNMEISCENCNHLDDKQWAPYHQGDVV